MLQSGCFGGVDSKGEVHVTGRHYRQLLYMFWVHEEMCYLLLSEVRVLQSGELREER